MLRKIISVVIALLLVLMLYVTLTVPAFEATAPAILTIALGVLLYFVWPKNSKSRAETS